MNTRKMTLNEELFRMKQLFGHMGIPSRLITEGVSDTGLQILKGLESGSEIAIALPKASEAMRTAFISSLENAKITGGLEGMKTKFGGTMEEAATAFLKTLPEAEQTALLSKFSGVASEENIVALVGLEKAPSVEVSVKDLASDVRTMLEKRKTSGGSLTQSELILINDSIKAMESKAAGNTNIAKVVNGVKAEVDLIQNPINTTDLTNDLTNEYKGDTVTLPIEDRFRKNTRNYLNEYPSLSSESWTMWKPDFSKMNGIPNLETFNLKMAEGLEKIKGGDQSGWDLIPEKGFDEIGCKNWRTFLKEKYLKNEIIIERTLVGNGDGKWKINNLKVATDKDFQGIKTEKEVKTFDNLDLGVRGMSLYKVEIVPKDFKIVPDELLKIIKEVMEKRLEWINSSEYRERRKALTGESDSEVDDGILHIMNNIEKNLRIEFYYNKNGSWLGVVNNKPHTIEVQPRNNLEEIKGTLDHEVDHYMSLLLYGSVSDTTMKNLQVKFKDLFFKLEDPFIDSIPYLRNFWDIVMLASPVGIKSFRNYLLNDIEQQVRFNKLNFYFKNKYNLSINSKLTFEQTESAWREYLSWKRIGGSFNQTGVPRGLDDIFLLFRTYEVNNPTLISNPKNYNSHIEKLQTILNAVFSISALFVINELYE